MLRYLPKGALSYEEDSFSTQDALPPGHLGATVIAHLIWTLQCFQGFTDLTLIFTITPSSGWVYPSFKGEKTATVGSLDTRPNRQPAAAEQGLPGAV